FPSSASRLLHRTTLQFNHFALRQSLVKFGEWRWERGSNVSGKRSIGTAGIWRKLLAILSTGGSGKCLISILEFAVPRMSSEYCIADNVFDEKRAEIVDLDTGC